MDEMSVRVKGSWIYLYCVVDRAGHTVEFLLRQTRDLAATTAIMRQVIRHHGRPETITIDQRGNTTAAIQSYTRIHHTRIAIRHCKGLNGIVERDHRAVNRLTRPMLGFESFGAGCCTIAGLESMHAIRKWQLATSGERSHTPAEPFDALVA
ncbi:MAG: DDE-type integrase/transposase/recombinase [Nitrospira sp.]|nr:DDE-type integrase/transposase/recombinase [Nitrospira sp.]